MNDDWNNKTWALGEITKYRGAEYRELHAPVHGSWGRLVWKMEGDKSTPLLEKRALRLVTIMNAAEDQDTAVAVGKLGLPDDMITKHETLLKNHHRLLSLAKHAVINPLPETLLVLAVFLLDDEETKK